MGRVPERFEWVGWSLFERAISLVGSEEAMVTIIIREQDKLIA